ncbi:DNA polymerase III subunit gamma/tau [Aeromonas sp. BIGb0445]|uniref:DNA polymerase III subunit gamma/tau n=1 Tax=Aeromonas sp. BIGb0445 TaxID=2940593 RepID=UPI0021691BEE|nr:DNA polymerase III subunit gamma/tau [Aeromonas sp. BIGb0445]MCS3459032.1 DNA polymerase-3 subunit gamma/tau [Aeromonas sp. BIGb0445]
MSYQVLARKWRPHTFEQVVGQQHVLTALTNALDQGRLHHAYLLSGTRGVGKTTIARILAKSLNCEQGISSTPCGVCGTCKEIDQGNFVDLLEIDAASRTKVEDTRELLDNVQYRPARGRFKVYLIDEVHMLSRHSFNALLKTLEEPPPYVKFLLATTDPQKLPITILSRCLQFHLKSLDQSQIAKQLEWVLGEEGQPFEPRALLALAKAADGSMRDALSLTDQALAHGNGSVGLASVLTMLGTLDHHHLHQLLEAILRQDAPATMAKITEIATLGPDFDQLHAELEALLHRVAMAQLLPASVQEQGADADALLQLAGAMSPEEVQLCYQIVLGGRKDLPWAPDGRTALEMTCLRMLAFSPRRAQLHPASLAPLPSQAGQGAAPLGLGKSQGVTASPTLAPQGTESTSTPLGDQAEAATESVADLRQAGITAENDTEHQADLSPSSAALVKQDGDDESFEPALSPLFAEQEALLQAADQMGYQPSPAPVAEDPAPDPGLDEISASGAMASPDIPVPAHGEPAMVHPAANQDAEPVSMAQPVPQPMAQPPEAATGSDGSGGILSLLGTRNMLRSRLRASDTDAAPRTARTPSAPKAGAGQTAAPVSPPAAQQAGPGSAQTAMVAPASSVPDDWSYDELPSHDDEEDNQQDYQEYLAQGEQGVVTPPRQAERGRAPAPALSQRTPEEAAPPWDPQGPSTGIQQPIIRDAAAASPPAAGQPARPAAAQTVLEPSRAVPAQMEATAPVLETIDWDSIDSDQAQEEPGDEPSKLLPASLLDNCGDPWGELIARTRMGGRLRQLAINGVMVQEGSRVLLTLKPEQRHLVSDRALMELAAIIGPALGGEVQVEVTLGTVPDCETPLEIEQRLYLGVREQVKRDLEQDPNIQFLRQRFGAELHMDSIEPLNR